MQQRASTRERVLKPGSIEFGVNSMACMVRNFSEKGAVLDISSSIGLPDSFTPVLTLDARRISARVIWQRNMRLGVAFESI